MKEAVGADLEAVQVETLRTLATVWLEEANTLRRRGAEAQGDLLADCAMELCKLWERFHT